MEMFHWLSFSNMRQCHLIWLGVICIICAICFTACTDTYNPSSGYKPSNQARNISVYPSDIVVPGTSFVTYFNVTSLNVLWTLENRIPWAKIQNMNKSCYDESKEVVLNIDANPSITTKRMGVVYVNSVDDAWPYEGVVSVTQSTAEPTASCAYSNIEMEGGASSKQIEYSTNLSSPPTISCLANWLNVSTESRYITFTAEPNPGEMRSTYVYFRWEQYGISFSIHVYQLSASVSIATDTLRFPNSSAYVTLDIAAQMHWYATSSYSWVSVSPEYGTVDSTSLSIYVLPNAGTEKRMGSVQLIMYNTDTTDVVEYVTIPLLQDESYLYVEDTCVYDISCEETVVEVQVNSNVSWAIQNIPDWITVSPSSGIGSQEILVTVQSNTALKERQCVLDITKEGTTLHAPISIHQRASLFTSEKTIYFPDSASTIDHYIDAAKGLPWTIATDCTWISFSTTEGVGPTTVGVSVTENTIYDNERVGEFLIYSGDSILNVLVRQQGKYFNIKNDQVLFASSGGSMDVSISTNDHWTAHLEDEWIDWITFTKDGNTLKIKVADNPSAYSREAVLVVEASEGRSLRIYIQQKERTLNLSALDVFFFANGGKSDPIEVHTDGRWEISKDENWFDYTLYDNSFVVEATPLVNQFIRTGTITVTLTDVTDGVLSVTLLVQQMSQGGIFTIDDYGSDINWNPSMQNDNKIQITIIGYGTDKNWN